MTSSASAIPEVMDRRVRTNTLEHTQGRSFSLKRFHDELLAFGSIPVPLIARLMTEPLAS